MRTVPLLPAQLRITATQGRGVSRIQVMVDESLPSAAAGLALLARVAPDIARIDREVRLSVEGESRGQ